MFSNIIEFSSVKEYVEKTEIKPEPIKNNFPDWFKNLKHNDDDRTVKGCMPFLETLSTGYLLRLPQDFRLQHNVLTNDGINVTNFKPSLEACPYLVEKFGINLNVDNKQIHGNEQLKGSPYLKLNKNLPVNKIFNPWIIKTPPGYSCLFVPPLNNSDDRFSIIPGIVQTDKFELEINFPFIVNGDKYRHLDCVLKKGTPYVQIIPFKRENWKMKIKKIDKDKIFINKVFYLSTSLLHKLKKMGCKLTSWK